jgi:hypothetical protein
MSKLRPGDIILFDNSDTSDLVHLASNFLSNAIDCVSGARLSHSAMVFDFDIPINGKSQQEIHIVENTILGSVDGVQLNPLSGRLAGYRYAIACHLSERIREYLDFGGMWAMVAGDLSRERYNIPELFAYLARHIPIIQEIPQLYQSDEGASVCSEYLVKLLRWGGLPGLNPAVMTPRHIAEMRMYSGYTQLAGEARVIPRFNSV